MNMQKSFSDPNKIIVSRSFKMLHGINESVDSQTNQNNIFSVKQLSSEVQLTEKLVEEENNSV